MNQIRVVRWGSRMEAAGKGRRAVHEQLLGLDVVRFVAALMVMSFHLAYWSWAKPDSPTAAISGGTAFPALEPVAWFGWVGVQIFFVVSGFVIALTANGATPVDFLRRRVIRLYPAAWICATITLAAWLALGSSDARSLVVPYLHSIVLFPQAPWIDGSYWTLGVEISFYGVIFLLLCCNAFRHVTAVAGALAGLSAAYWLFEQVSQLHLHNQQVFKLTLAPHGCHFALGMMLWLVVTRGWTPARAGVIALALGAGVLQIIGEVATKTAETGQAHAAWAPVLTWLAMVGVIALSSAWNARILPVARGWAPGIRLIGLMTYPLYLLHDVVGAGVMGLLRSAGVGPEAALAAAILVCIAASFAVAAWLEPALQRWLRFALGRVVALAAYVRLFQFLFRSTRTA